MKRLVSAGLSTVVVIALGFAPGWSAHADDLVPDPSITGTVSMADRSPVANATVELVSSGASVASTVTAANGSYRLDAADGTYSLRVTPSGKGLSRVSSLSIDLPRQWPVDFVLTPQAPGRVMLTGDVTLSTGTPVSGGNVLFAGAGNAIASTGYFVSATAPGTTGTWSLNTRAATPGGTSLIFMASGGPRLTMTQDTYADFVIPMTTTVVRVTDANGAPLANAPIRLNSGGFGLSNSTVTLLAEQSAFSSNWTASGRTNADGVLALTRPELAASTTVNLMVDPPSASWLPASSVVSLPVTGGELSTTLALRAPAPAPSPTASATPSPTSTPSPTPSSSPTPTPSVTSAPELVTASGTVMLSDGTRVPGAVVIPRDPRERVNGGNSADATGRYSVAKPQGFTGHWSISCRSQSSRAIQDELCFSLTGGDDRTWTSDLAVDFTVPMNLYRVRVVDQSGAGIPNVRIVAAVPGSGRDSSARVQVLPGETPFVGSWRGFDTTGTDGWAQVPGVTMLNDVSVILSVDADSSSPYAGQMVTVAASELSDTVIALELKAPSITAVAPSRVSAGDTITVVGGNLLATSRVTLGGIPATFAVVDNTKLTVEVPSNARGGSVEVISAGGQAISTSRIDVLAPALAIETETFPNGRVGSPYSITLEASGGVAPYRWRIYGTRPSGVNLTPTGQLVGTPLRTMSRDLAVAVFDSAGKRVIRRIPITIEPRPMSEPAAVRVVGGRGSSQRVSLSWRAPADDGGNPITGYRIEASTDAGGTWQVVIDNTRSRSTSRSFPYPAGVPSIFRVAAINALGSGPFTAEGISPTITAYGPPTAPQDIVVAPGSGQLQVQWTEPANAGGTPIQGYRIRVSTNGRSWSTVISHTRSQTTSATLRVRAGRSYYVQVAARNAAGIGAFAASSALVQVR